MTTQNSGIQQHLAPAELCINHNISTSELEIVQKKLFKRWNIQQESFNQSKQVYRPKQKQAR